MASPAAPAAADDRWGRVPGAAPPLRSGAPLVFAAAVCTVLTAVVLMVLREPGPLVEPTFADQRNGLVLDGPRLPADLLGVRFGGRPVVLLFLRAAPADEALAAWTRQLPDSAEVVVVVQAPAPAAAGQIVDPAEALADAVALPTPQNAFEAATLIAATS